MRFLFVAGAVALVGAPPTAARADKPSAIPWSQGDETPFGYHLEPRTRKGPIVAGAILLGVAYGVAVFSIWDERASKWLFVPVAGPFLAADDNDRRRWKNFDDLGRNGFLWMNGAAQVGAVAAIVCGIVWRRDWWVRDGPSASSFQIAPLVAGGGRGLAVIGSF